MTTAGLGDQQRLADTGETGEIITPPIPPVAANKYHQHPSTIGHRPRGQQQSVNATSVSFHYQDKTNTQLQYKTTPTTIRRDQLNNNPQDGINNTNLKHHRENHVIAPTVSNERNNFYPNQGLDNEQGDTMTNGHREHDDDGSSEEELMAVASAEEYAAKITKLQQACLIPLKEDLADWLNKILKTSNITSENFMHNLDNGVIICRLAKIISLWCELRLADSGMGPITNSTSTSSTNINSTRNEKMIDLNNREHASQAQFKRNRLYNANGPLRSNTSQSISCLATSISVTSLNGGLHYHSSNQFTSNLIRMHQTKIWEDAKCRTFYARDNVCNFIKWSKDFGVNQSVLFESDDLVLHANPRQVVLCLLDVARIAYVKYGFTEAPGLVKFEQEIDKELQASESSSLRAGKHGLSVLANARERATDEICDGQDDESSSQFERLNKTRNSTNDHSMGIPIDATDKLVMRYCRHKEEEAARKKKEELAAIAAAAALSAEAESTIKSDDETPILTNHISMTLVSRDVLDSKLASNEVDSSAPDGQPQPSSKEEAIDSLMNCENESHFSMEEACDEFSAIVSSTSDSKTNNIKHLADTGRIDSLDSGEGPTESASTGHSSSRMLAENLISARKSTQGTNHTSIPVPTKRTNYTPSQISHQAESSMHSELSSSRSSLLSNQDGNISNYERQATSDLDGKVMRIAKSYYGKKASKDITRLSEGKYRIADRIVFVRLLKGHRVMVRIGGGWDTLENFLLRHKSDPSQVIDPDNLLPLETKMPFDKTPQATPTKSSSKLPHYRLTSSASSNNLSLANLSTSNHSLISSTTHNGGQFRGKQTIAIDHSSPSQGLSLKNSIIQSSSAHNSPVTSHIKRPFYYNKMAIPHSTNKYNHHRPLASTLAPTASATNIHLYDSSVRSQATRRDRGPNQRLLLK